MLLVLGGIYWVKWMERYLEGVQRGHERGTTKGEPTKMRRNRWNMEGRHCVNVGEIDCTGLSDLLVHLPSPGREGESDDDDSWLTVDMGKSKSRTLKGDTLTFLSVHHDSAYSVANKRAA
jgi:hypothetical protein